MRLEVLCACAIGAVALTSQAQAAAQDKPQTLDLPLEGVRTTPDWRVKPTSDDLQREYPPLAQAIGVDGNATITCQAEPDGRVDDCHVTREDPEGLGFGAAAIRMAAYFVMKPGTLDGRPVASPVSVPLHFHTDLERQPLPEAEPSGPPPSPTALKSAEQIVALEQVAIRERAAWSAFIERETARAVVEGDSQTAQPRLDALRLALEETITWDVERQARILARSMSQPDLDATAAFMSSPAGQALIVADIAGASKPNTFNLHLGDAVRRQMVVAQEAAGGAAKPR